jgi:hypothetical protein
MTGRRPDGYSVAGAVAGVVSIAPSECGCVPASAGGGDGITGAVELASDGTPGADPSGVIRAVVGSAEEGAAGMATGAGSVDTGSAAGGVSAAAGTTAGAVGAAEPGSVGAGRADPTGVSAALTGSVVADGWAGRDAGATAPSECGSVPAVADAGSLEAGSVSAVADAGSAVAFSAGGLGATAGAAGSAGVVCAGALTSAAGSEVFSGGSAWFVAAVSGAGTAGGAVRVASGDGRAGATVAGAVVTAESAGAVVD